MTPHKTPIYRQRGRRLGIVFEDVSAYGKQAGSRTVLDLPAILEGALKVPWNWVASFTGQKSVPRKAIIQGVTGVVFPGETLLVLGQPGSGCSTTLKVLANEDASYEKVEGDVSYACISSHHGKEVRFRGCL